MSKFEIMKKLTILLILLGSVITLYAQNEDKKSRKEIKAEKEAQIKVQVKQMIEDRKFEFVPRTALPSSGKSISINSYNVQITGDDLVSYLPYYGRAYSASYGSTTSPLNVEGVIENYTEKKVKEKYKIEFNVKSDGDDLFYSFQIFENGSASLNVRSNYRQPISFNGQIEEIKAT